MSDSKSTEEQFRHLLEIGLTPLFDVVDVKQSDRNNLFNAISRGCMVVHDQELAKRVEGARIYELRHFKETLESSHLCGGGSETSDTVTLIVYMLDRRLKHMEATLNNQEKK